MNVNSNTILAIAITAWSLAGGGCTKQDTATTSAVGATVLTVDDYLKQPDLRRKVFVACANDPGRKRDDPNCVNALRAERVASAGTGNFPNATP